jgi:hypothetical protein
LPPPSFLSPDRPWNPFSALQGSSNNRVIIGVFFCPVQSKFRSGAAALTGMILGVGVPTPAAYIIYATILQSQFVLDRSAFYSANRNIFNFPARFFQLHISNPEPSLAPGWSYSGNGRCPLKYAKGRTRPSCQESGERGGVKGK